MQLQFGDKSRIEIISILGGPRFVQNANRDVLTIKIPTKEGDLTKLQTIFKNKEKLKDLKTVIIEKFDDEDGVEQEKELISELGSHYTIYLSCSNKIEEIPSTPGVIEPPKFEEHNEVEIGQVTYIETLLEQALAK